MKQSIMEKLCLSTTRIEVFTENNKQSCGTGFLFQLESNAKEDFLLLVTAKHVVLKDGVQSIKFLLNDTNVNNQSTTTSPINILLSKEEVNLFKPHPDPKIDLCAIKLFPLIKKFTNKKISLFSIKSHLIPTKEDIEQFDAVEDIIMIGYPNALWDSKHNRPLVRRGITATDLKYDFKGDPIFEIDACSTPGSSGSPVFTYGNYIYHDKDCILSVRKPHLVGILCGMEETRIKENLLKADNPDEIVAYFTYKIPIHLGIVIKAQMLHDFKSCFS
jgi:hypothetical protein